MTDALPAFGGTPLAGRLIGHYGTVLWESDLTAEGTRPVVDLAAGGAASLWGLSKAGETLFLESLDASEAAALWATDGTAGGTRKLATLPDLADQVASVGSTLFFFIEGDRW